MTNNYNCKTTKSREKGDIHSTKVKRLRLDFSKTVEYYNDMPPR